VVVVVAAAAADVIAGGNEALRTSQLTYRRKARSGAPFLCFGKSSTNVETKECLWYVRIMPVYEYKAEKPGKGCVKCSVGFEYLRNLSDPPMEECPHCGAPVEKQISAPFIGGSKSGFDDRAKGAGFHKFQKLGKGEYEKQY